MYDELKKRLEGMAYSVNTPFEKDGDIDYKGLERLLNYCIDQGANSIVLTYGDSVYSLLTDREVGELTKKTVEIVNRRVPVVAADRQWWTGEEIKFAEYCKEIGADLLMVLPPDWAASCTESTMTDHYIEVSKHMPVMVVTNVFVKRGMTFGLNVMRHLKEKAPGVIAVKDDFTGDFGRRLGLLSKDTWTFMMGGTKEKFMESLDYGCNAYFSTFLPINPAIARDFYRYIQSNDHQKAIEIIAKYEIPFFDTIMKFKGGFDAGMRAAIHLNDDLMPCYRRAPYANPTEEEILSLKHTLKDLNIL
ncbi:MAG TPA: hypothetical protein DDZ89_14895 [Clostridiales bacterium]|nr:hypothetical protein [Clostridiales bacterium]